MTASEFKAYLPEFSSDDDDAIERAITRASLFVGEDRWGTFYSEGLANLAAHFLVDEKARAARGTSIKDIGATTEKHVGPVGTSFDSAVVQRQADDPLMTTDYGRQYCRLRRIVGKGGLIIR